MPDNLTNYLVSNKGISRLYSGQLDQNKFIPKSVLPGIEKVTSTSSAHTANQLDHRCFQNLRTYQLKPTHLFLLHHLTRNTDVLIEMSYNYTFSNRYVGACLNYDDFKAPEYGFLNLPIRFDITNRGGIQY